MVATFDGEELTESLSAVHTGDSAPQANLKPSALLTS
jgi:hypothetical protein